MKRITLFIIWIAICLIVCSNLPKRQTGDINNDRKVTTTDLVILSRYLVEMVDLTEHDLKYADMNNDGVIDVLDLALLRIKLAGGEP